MPSFFISSLSDIGKTPPNARISINLDKISFSISIFSCLTLITSRIALLQSKIFSSLLYSLMKIVLSSFFIISSLIVRFIRTSVTSAIPVSSSILGALSLSISPFGLHFSPSQRNRISFFFITRLLECYL